MTIQSFSKSLVWEQRNVVLPVVAIGVPLAIEGGFFLARVIKDPAIVKKNIIEMKKGIVDAFHQRENESSSDFKKRLRRNLVITTIATLLIGIAVTCPYVFLPTAFAIPVALSAVFAIGKLFLAIQRNPSCFRKVKLYVKDAFEQRQNESIEAFHARRWKAIKHIALYLLLFTAALAATAVAPYISILVAKASSLWSMNTLIPFQSKGVVFAEYLLVGSLHAVQAARYFMKGERARGVFHATAAATAIFFPFWYIFSPGGEMRLHHSFIGLALQLAPSQAVRTLGTFIVADSALYCFSKQRGYVKSNGRFESYDFMNTVYDQLPVVLQALVSLTLLEKTLDYFSKKSVTASFTTKLKENTERSLERD